jgi:hypothetical protein
VVALIYLVVSLRKHRTVEQVARGGAVALLALLVFGVAFVGTSEPVLRSAAGTLVGERMASLGNLNADSSLGTRWRTYVTTNRALSDHLLAGRGLGSRVALTGSGWMTYSTEGQYVDNVPQTVVLKVGLIGLGLLTLLWAHGIRRSLQSPHRPSTLRDAYLYALPGLGTLLFTSSYLVIYQQLFVLCVVVGLLMREQPNPPTPPNPAS